MFESLDENGTARPQFKSNLKSYHKGLNGLNSFLLSNIGPFLLINICSFVESTIRRDDDNEEALGNQIEKVAKAQEACKYHEVTNIEVNKTGTRFFDKS